MRRTDLPKAKVEKALELKKQGKTYAYIARATGIHQGSLSTVFGRYGLSKPHPYIHYERVGKAEKGDASESPGLGKLFGKWLGLD